MNKTNRISLCSGRAYGPTGETDGEIHQKMHVRCVKSAYRVGRSNSVQRPRNGPRGEERHGAKHSVDGFLREGMAQPAAWGRAGRSSYPACTISRHRTLGRSVSPSHPFKAVPLCNIKTASDHILAVKKKSENVSNRVGTRERQWEKALPASVALSVKWAPALTSIHLVQKDQRPGDLCPPLAVIWEQMCLVVALSDFAAGLHWGPAAMLPMSSMALRCKTD